MELLTTYKDHNYPVVIAENALSIFKERFQHKQLYYIVDQVVASLHEDKIKNLVGDDPVFYVGGGESLKSLQRYEEIMELLLESGVTRQSVIIAVGGGSVGDFAGFVAATILRGVQYVQIPTTILAHDSAVGGKVGINARAGKNLIGAFKRPEGVYYDPSFLSTLPYEEILSGFGEIIKHAMLTDHQTVIQLKEEYPTKELLEKMEGIEYWLTKGIQLKLIVVIKDEKEAGQRKFLNLGHTFGHALEFIHKIPHGHAVMYGLVMMLILSKQPYEEIWKWLKSLHLPVIELFDFKDYFNLMKKDKKNEDEAIQFILIDDYGKPYVNRMTEPELYKGFQIFTALVGGKDED